METLCSLVASNGEPHTQLQMCNSESKYSLARNGEEPFFCSYLMNVQQVHI